MLVEYFSAGHDDLRMRRQVSYLVEQTCIGRTFKNRAGIVEISKVSVMNFGVERVAMCAMSP